MLRSHKQSFMQQLSKLILSALSLERSSILLALDALKQALGSIPLQCLITLAYIVAMPAKWNIISRMTFECLTWLE